MIARIWRGTVRETDKDIYLEYLKKTGLQEYADTPGNRGVYTLRRVAEGKCEFLLLTLWDSWEAIKAFAGDDYEKAVYYPEDEKFLLDLERLVEHYELIDLQAQKAEETLYGLSLCVVVRPDLKLRNGVLTTVANPDGEFWVNTRIVDGKPVAFVNSQSLYFIPEHAEIPWPQAHHGEELWIEATIPRAGTPRPMRLATKNNGVLTPLPVN